VFGSFALSGIRINLSRASLLLMLSREYVKLIRFHRHGATYERDHNRFLRVSQFSESAPRLLSTEIKIEGMEISGKGVVATGGNVSKTIRVSYNEFAEKSEARQSSAEGKGVLVKPSHYSTPCCFHHHG